MRQRDERGFTIVELMIVVAIIAVLAIVVIPSFMKESKRGKSKSEVHPMMAELSTREENYKSEYNTYLAAPACPAAASSTGTDMTNTSTAACALNAGQPWVQMRVQASQSKLTCSYEVAIGNNGINPSTHASWPTWATAPTSAPAVHWYFIVATCPDTEYLWASWDSKLKSQDGH